MIQAATTSFIIALQLAAGATHSGVEHEDHGSFPPVTQGTEAAACESGVSAGYACRNIELLSRMPLEELGEGTGSDSWGWKDSLTNRQYALVGRSNGVGLVDVTDPVNPIYVGNLPSTRDRSTWRDLKTYADHPPRGRTTPTY